MGVGMMGISLLNSHEINFDDIIVKMMIQAINRTLPRESAQI